MSENPTQKRMGFWKTEWFSPPSAEEQKYKVGPTMVEYETMMETRKSEVLAKVAPMSDEELEDLVDYVANATGHTESRGFALCRICDHPLGYKDMLTPDGKFVFPQGWEHYFLIHSVRPDEDFVAAARAWAKDRVFGTTKPSVKPLTMPTMST